MTSRSWWACPLDPRPFFALLLVLYATGLRIGEALARAELAPPTGLIAELQAIGRRRDYVEPESSTHRPVHREHGGVQRDRLLDSVVGDEGCRPDGPGSRFGDKVEDLVRGATACFCLTRALS
jgi:hypothetical protein